MRAVNRGFVDEHLRVVSLAEQPAVMIREADDDGLDAAALDEIAQLVERQTSPRCASRPSPLGYLPGVVHTGPRNLWRSNEKYHTLNTIVRPPIVFAARMPSGMLRMTAMNTTHTIATMLTAAP